MDYRIISANADIGQIEVTFSKNGTDIATYCVDVPIVDGAFITGAALDADIQLRAPSWVVERKEAVLTATGFSAIQALVQAPVIAPAQVTPTSVTADLNQEVIRAMIYQVLAENNIATV